MSATDGSGIGTSPISKRSTVGSVRTVPRGARTFLGVTVCVDGGLALYLALRDIALAKTATATFGAAVLLTVSFICLWALIGIVRGLGSWLNATLLSQAITVFIAGYIWLVDERSPISQLIGKAGVALLIGGVAIAWIVYLGRHAKIVFTKSAAVVAALFPLLGLFQFWVEGVYLPRVSRPLVDMQVELTPAGASGHKIHLLAKVILHNRGTVQADIPGALMRVTVYPKDLRPLAASPEAVAQGIDLSAFTAGNDYRAASAPASRARLIYADDFVAAGSFLVPGIQIEYKKIIDIDADSVGLARLSVSAAFITQRRVEATRTCFPPRVTVNKEPLRFSKEVTKLISTESGGHFLCVENQIAPVNVVHALVSDNPILRVYMVINDPTQPSVEYPQLFAQYGTRRSIDQPLSNPEDGYKIDDDNPSVSFRDVEAEYSPKDSDLSPVVTAPASAGGG
jgi:hypothetical protein